MVKHTVTLLVGRLERVLSPNSYPRTIAHALAIRARVLGEFVLRTLGGERFPLSEKRRLLAAVAKFGEGASVVLANGPSLTSASTSLEPLWIDSEVRRKLCVFGVNRFWASDVSKRVTLDFLVLSDPAYLPGSQGSRAVEVVDYLKPRPKVSMIAPFSWKSRLDANSLGLANEVFFFDDRSLEFFSNNIKPWKPRGYMTATALKALAIAAVASGRVFILGFDNNLHLGLEVSDENQILQKSFHANAAFTLESENRTPKLPRGLADYFFDVSRGFHDLYLFSRVRITNLDSKSLVHHFPKSPSALKNDFDGIA